METKSGTVQYKGFVLNLSTTYTVTYHFERVSSEERKLVIDSVSELACRCGCNGVVHTHRILTLGQLCTRERLTPELVTADLADKLEEDRIAAELAELREADKASAARFKSALETVTRPVVCVRHEMNSGVYFVTHEQHQNGWLCVEIKEELSGRNINMFELCTREGEGSHAMQTMLLLDCPEDIVSKNEPVEDSRLDALFAEIALQH